MIIELDINLLSWSSPMSFMYLNRGLRFSQESPMVLLGYLRQYFKIIGSGSLKDKNKSESLRLIIFLPQHLNYQLPQRDCHWPPQKPQKSQKPQGYYLFHQSDLHVPIFLRMGLVRTISKKTRRSRFIKMNLMRS